MPKKTKQPIEEEEPEYEPPADYSEPEEDEPIRISKKTGKPVRPMSEKQLEALRINREKATAKKKELKEARDYETKTEIIKKVKEEQAIKHKEKLENSKKKYEEEVETLEPQTFTKKPEKKIKKKVIKYVEASSSSESEEEEVIIRKKKKDKSKPPQVIEQSIPEQITRQNLRNKLQDEQSASLAKLMMPSYF